MGQSPWPSILYISGLGLSIWVVTESVPKKNIFSIPSRTPSSPEHSHGLPQPPHDSRATYLLYRTTSGSQMCLEGSRTFFMLSNSSGFQVRR